jgi:hypothetical protein
MRHLITLCLISLCACTSPAPPQPKPADPPAPPATTPSAEVTPPTKSAPSAEAKPTAEVEVDIDALVKRDKLLVVDEELEFMHSLSLVSAQRVELNGVAPRELIIHIEDEEQGEEAETRRETLWVYDVQDAANPRQIPMPALDALEGAERAPNLLAWNASLRSWWSAEDLDRDGKAELILVTGPDYEEEVPLYVLGWGRRADGSEGLVERLWRAPMGGGAALLDTDGDGTREIIVSSRAPLSLATMRMDERGYWRASDQPLKAKLPAMLDLLTRGEESSAELELRSVVIALMRQRKLLPNDLAAYQARLTTQLKDSASWRYEELVWPGNDAAYDVLSPMLTPALYDSELIDALLQLDATLKKRRGRAAVLKWFKARLRAYGSTDGGMSEPLASLSRHKLDVSAELVAALRAEETALDARVDLLHASVPFMLSQQEALWELDGDLQHAFPRVLCEMDTEALVESGWLARLDTKRVQALLESPETYQLGLCIAEMSDDPALRATLYAELEAPRHEKGSGLYPVTEDRLLKLVMPPELLARLLERESLDWYGERLLREVLLSWNAPLQLALLEHAPSADVFATAVKALSYTLCAEGEDDDHDYDEDEDRDDRCGSKALLTVQPALHQLLMERVKDEDVAMRDAAVALMSYMSHEPTQRFLLALAREGGPQARRAHEGLLRERPAFAKDYFRESLELFEREQDLYAYAALLDKADAQRLMDSLSRQEPHAQALALLVRSAGRVCAPNQRPLTPLVASNALTCDEYERLAIAHAVCSPAALLNLATERSMRRCGGEALLIRAITRVGAKGHLAALKQLSDHPSSRKIREAAAHATRLLTTSRRKK